MTASVERTKSNGNQNQNGFFFPLTSLQEGFNHLNHLLKPTESL